VKKIKINTTKTHQSLYCYPRRIPVLVRNLFFEFISNLYQGVIELEEAERPFIITNIIEDGQFSNSITLDNVKSTYVLIEIDEKQVILFFKSYWENDMALYHEVSLNSQDEFDFFGNDFYEYLLDNSLLHSQFKGAYINVEDDDFQNFYKHELPERSFSDIFLPDVIIQDLKAFKTIFEKREKLLRYLFVGVPGSGKTESVIVLANELQKKGVTILKASTNAIKNAVRFANILAPALIILDDVDLELGNRDNYSHTESLGDFLDVLDGVEKISPNVGILATTNSLWLVDAAAQRPGRFNKILSFGELTKQNIKAIILKSLKNAEMEDFSLLADDDIVEVYRHHESTGAYIYNMTQMLANQIDIEMIPAYIQPIVAYIENDIKVLKRMRRNQQTNEN
jgi:hypothetical protein